MAVCVAGVAVNRERQSAKRFALPAMCLRRGLRFKSSRESKQPATDSMRGGRVQAVVLERVVVREDLSGGAVV